MFDQHEKRVFSDHQFDEEDEEDSTSKEGLIFENVKSVKEGQYEGYWNEETEEREGLGV